MRRYALLLCTVTCLVLAIVAWRYWQSTHDDRPQSLNEPVIYKIDLSLNADQLLINGSTAEFDRNYSEFWNKYFDKNFPVAKKPPLTVPDFRKPRWLEIHTDGEIGWGIICQILDHGFQHEIKRFHVFLDGSPNEIWIDDPYYPVEEGKPSEVAVMVLNLESRDSGQNVLFEIDQWVHAKKPERAKVLAGADIASKDVISAVFVIQKLGIASRDIMYRSPESDPPSPIRGTNKMAITFKETKQIHCWKGESWRDILYVPKEIFDKAYQGEDCFPQEPNWLRVKTSGKSEDTENERLQDPNWWSSKYPKKEK